MSFSTSASVDALNVELAAVGLVALDNNALLAAVLSGSGDCIKILDLEGRLQFMSEGGKRVMEVDDFSQLKGCPWPDLWADAGNSAAKQAIVEAREGKTARFLGAANTARGTPKFWDVRVMPIRDAEGKPTHLLSISTDISEQRNAELALRESEIQVRLALSAAQMGVWQCDVVDGALVDVTGDDRAVVLLGGTPGEAIGVDTFGARVDMADRVGLAAAIVQTLDPAGDDILDVEYRVMGRGGEAERWVHARAQAIRSGKGVRLVGTVRDVSDRKAAEARQQMLGAELQHRIKNTLAMVSAIAVQTLRGDDIAERRTAFSARLQALGQAQDLLTAKSWQSAPIRSVIESALLPHASEANDFIVEGEDVPLSARQALSLSLAIHELATNAAKYGALSTPGGRAYIRWGIQTNAVGAAIFSLAWRESGGPTVVAPERAGFGTRLITRVLAADFDGDVSIEYPPSGVVCVLVSPASNVAAFRP